jgi:hypothetical protein
MPSPFPVPTFASDGGEVSATSLLSFMGFLKEHMSGDPSAISEQNRQIWAEVITSLTDEFMASFPTPEELPWNALHEKIKLAETALDVLTHITQRTDAAMGFFSSSQFSTRVFAGLFKLCNILDHWMEMEISPEEGVILPSTLRIKTFAVAVAVTRCLGGSMAVMGRSDGPTWKTLKVILTECLDLVDGRLDFFIIRSEYIYNFGNRDAFVDVFEHRFFPSELVQRAPCSARCRHRRYSLSSFLQSTSCIDIYLAQWKPSYDDVCLFIVANGYDNYLIY